LAALIMARIAYPFKYTTPAWVVLDFLYLLSISHMVFL